MKTYCICLPSRYQHTSEFFKTMEIDPKYTKISTIKELEETGAEELRLQGIIDNTYEIKNKSYYGKIACSLSHINALNTFLETDDNMCLIFEDDNHIPSTDEVPTIKKHINNITNELSTFTGWYFCNLSPCLSTKYSQKKVSENLHIGLLGYCMNAYLVSRSGARNLINKLPLTMKNHTLDTFIPSLGRNYPFQAFDVHPRVFRQKDNHTFDSTLGNDHKKNSIAVEYVMTRSKNTESRLKPNVLIICAIFLAVILGKHTVLIIISLLIILLMINIKRKQHIDVYTIPNIEWDTRVNDLLKLIKYEDINYGQLYNPIYDSYRLGDMVLWNKWRKKPDGERYHLEKFPDSIACEYMRLTNNPMQYDILFNIVKKRKQQINILPKQSLIIHLRLGDLIERSGKNLDYLLVRQVKNKNGGASVKPLYYYYEKINKIRNHGIKEITLVAGSHFDVPLNSSYKYICAIKIFFEELGFSVSIRTGNSPDNDFVFMSSSKYYIPSEGGYSRLIKEMVLKSGNIIL